MSFTYSPLQLAIFDFIRDSKASLVIDAKAGAAKTTTILGALTVLPPRLPGALVAQQIRFLAFNKLIADTLKTKVPPHVHCSTFHSLGLSALKNLSLFDPALVRSRDFINSSKCRKMVWNACDRDNPDTNNIIKLISLAKNAGIGAIVDDTPEAWNAIISHHEVELEDPKGSVHVARNILDRASRDYSCIDFDDMLYLALRLNAPFAELDYLFVDESQDTNAIQLEIMSRCAGPTSRVIAVGDPHQAIYGFRGANPDSMDKIVKRFNAKTLPLSVSYRCSKAVIREAQRLVPDIQAWDASPEGAVNTLASYDASLFVPGSAILCRLNAPLVAFAYALLQRDVPCTILGRDVGKQLTDLVKKLRGVNLEDLLTKLKVWETREAEALIADGKSPERITDQADCLRFFINGLDEDSRSIASLLAKIALMFTDDTTTSGGRVTLSSMHKSKGLEYPVVFILDRELIPSRFARQAWQLQQEKNLLYVAQTRAKHTLNYIKSDSWKEASDV